LEDLADPYERQVLERLWDYYIKSVQKVLDTGIIGKMNCRGRKDYTGIDRDPFETPLFK